MKESFLIPAGLRRLIAARLARSGGTSVASRRRRVCIYKVDRWGDFVLATGAIRLLVAHFGPAECRLIVSTTAEALARTEFPEIDCWTTPASANRLWREIRPLRRAHAGHWATEHFGDLVCLRHAPSLYRDLSLSWLRADRWHGLDARPAGQSLAMANRPGISPNYPKAAEIPWCRELMAHRKVLAAVLRREITWDEIRPRLAYVPVEPGPEIVLCPFGAERIRDYPVASWVASLSESFRGNAAVRVLGTASRQADLEQLTSALRAAGVHAVSTANATPGEFMSRLGAARLVVTIDSAAAHIATALGKPAVVVTGGGHFGWFSPWGTRELQRWVHHPLPCYGCGWDCTRQAVDCMQELPPGLVARAIKEVLPR